MKIFKYLTITGNILFILWVTFNGIDEGFRGTLFQKVSYIGLVILLVLNISLLLRKK